MANPKSRVDSAATVLRLKLLGANPSPQVAGIDELAGKSNYFLGSDPSEWHTNVPTYAQVKYRGVYPGIDLVYHGNQRQLEYDFLVAPGANPGAIRLSFEGAEGMEIDAQGNLVLHTAAGEVREHKPVVYQEIAGSREAIASGYVLQGKDEVGFAVARYDTSQPLVIDPALSYSTYLGGSGFDEGDGIAVDSAGNAYVTGRTTSANFPITPGAFKTTFGGDLPDGDAFVTKLNASGSALVYSTYLGGSGNDIGAGIAVDSAGNAYVTGLTRSLNFPFTLGAFQTTFNGGDDAFVTKLNPAGSQLVYSTYLGGSGNDFGVGIAVDSAGNAYVTGYTTSVDFPFTLGAFQTTNRGGQDAFVTKLNPGGSQLVYSTYLGGSGNDIGNGIVVDSARNAYVTGQSSSLNFPFTMGAFQTIFGGGASDAFVTKLNANGTALVYSTYLGGSGFDQGFGIAVDSAGNVYVTGGTGSTNFPSTTGAFQTTFNGGDSDAFVTKLNTNGSARIYSTYLGGSGGDFGVGIAVDSAGNAYVTGSTASTNFPKTTGAFQTIFGGGGFDAFVTKLKANGSQLMYSTYLGGSSGDEGLGITVDSASNAYVTGDSASTNFPKTTGAFQTIFGGGTCGTPPNTFPCEDAFIAKVVAAPNFSLSLSPTTRTIAAGQSTDYPLTVTPQELVGTVALSCAGAPAAATCGISPASVTLDGDGPTAAQTATVTVTTTARSLLWPRLRLPDGPSGPRLWLLLGVALALLGTLAMFSKLGRRATPLLLSAIFLLLLCIACGGGTSGGGTSGGGSPPPPTGTPAGTYTLTLTGTSGSVTHTTTVTLTVN